MLIFYDKEKKLLLNFMNNLKDINLKNMEFYSFSLSFWRKKTLLISI